MTIKTLLTIGSLATEYAIMLDRLERHFPIQPRYIWVEVVGGVIITMLPIMVARRTTPSMTADEYERLVLAGFVASGTPIILWQLLRHFR